MIIRFFVDPETDVPHIYNHNVAVEEVEEFFRNYHITEGDRGSVSPGQSSRIALGRTNTGRFLKVVYSSDKDGGGIFVITAYDLTGKALLAFRRRLRRRQR